MRTEADINAAVVQEVQPLAQAPRGPWRDAWRILWRRKIAMFWLAVILVYILIALVGFTGLLDSKIEETVGQSNDHPTLRHDGALSPALWIGTDFLKRSVMWRFLYGVRMALTVAFLSSILSIAIGVTLGTLAGYFGGWVDALITWLFSTVSSIPGVVLLIAMAYVLKDAEFPFWWFREKGKGGGFGFAPIALKGVPTIVLALGLTSWIGLCRIIRGEVLKHRDRDYVVAARAVGLRTPAILFKHILPNVFHLVIIDFSLGLAGFVQAEVVLSFLGLGITDRPSWGRMIDDAKLELLKGVWWQMAAATIAIFIFSLAVNLFGDALRDALDPKLRGVD